MLDRRKFYPLYRENDRHRKKDRDRVVVEVGAFCSEYQDKVFRNLKCQRIQVDEIVVSGVTFFDLR